jgi:hypothetical protein
MDYQLSTTEERVQRMRGASALAIQKGQTREKAAGLREIGTIRCDACGEEFIIAHRPALADKEKAERQQSGSEESFPFPDPT